MLLSAYKKAEERRTVEGDERIQISALLLNGFIGYQQQQQYNKTGYKAPDIKDCGQSQQHDTHVLECIAELIAVLREIADGND